MREWLSGGAPPCQGGGRGFDPRLALILILVITVEIFPQLFFCFVLRVDMSSGPDFVRLGFVGRTPEEEAFQSGCVERE